MIKKAHRSITADKRKNKDFPKLLSAASFIRKTLAETQLKTGEKR